LRLARGRAQERITVIEAADHPVQGHDVGGLDLVRDIGEVAVTVRDAVAEAAPLGFFLRCPKKCPGSVHVNRGARARGKKRQVHRADPAPDVQERAVFDSRRSEPVHEQPRGHARSIPAVAFQRGSSGFVIERFFDPDTLRAAHQLKLNAGQAEGANAESLPRRSRLRYSGSMYFFVRTQNPRPTFHLDMSPEERATMTSHVAYWSEKAARGIAIAFGPVMDPQGVYGVGIYKVQDEAEMRELLDHDPAKGLLSYQVLPMPRAVIGTLA
jgi:uncharacterized protein